MSSPPSPSLGAVAWSSRCFSRSRARWHRRNTKAAVAIAVKSKSTIATMRMIHFVSSGPCFEFNTSLSSSSAPSRGGENFAVGLRVLLLLLVLRKLLVDRDNLLEVLVLSVASLLEDGTPSSRVSTSSISTLPIRAIDMPRELELFAVSSREIVSMSCTLATLQNLVEAVSRSVREPASE